MTTLFITVLNMSITASFAALAVMLTRIPLKKAPKIFSYALWAVVLFRLIVPFSIESVFSLMPASSNAIAQTIVYSQSPEIQTGLGFMPENVAVGNAIASAPEVISHAGSACAGRTANMPPVESAVNPIATALQVAGYVWLAGFIGLLIYAATGYLRLRRRVRFATLVRDNIFEADKIKTPIVLGFIRPKIYIPICIDVNRQDYILKHEQTHIKRRDYLIKPLGFIAFALHWFNPLMWVSYLLMSKDMEMSCDEAVLRNISKDIRSEYSTSLLSFSVSKNSLLSPIAFGESGVKERVVNVLSFKRAKRWVLVLSAIAVLVVFVGFTSNRIMAVDSAGEPEEYSDKYAYSEEYEYGYDESQADGVEDSDCDDYECEYALAEAPSNYPQITFRVYNAYELAAALYDFDIARPVSVIVAGDFDLPAAVTISHPDITISGSAANIPTLTANGGNGFVVEAGANAHFVRLALVGGYGSGSGISIQGGHVGLHDIEISGFNNSGVRFGAVGGRLIMDSGTHIHSNTADYGGGVNVGGFYSEFIMYDGLISGNTANLGGGVYVSRGTNQFKMYGGMIEDNLLTCMVDDDLQ